MISASHARRRTSSAGMAGAVVEGAVPDPGAQGLELRGDDQGDPGPALVPDVTGGEVAAQDLDQGFPAALRRGPGVRTFRGRRARRGQRGQARPR